MILRFLSSLSNRILGSIEQEKEIPTNPYNDNNIDNIENHNEISYLLDHYDENQYSNEQNQAEYDNKKILPFISLETKILIANEINSGLSYPDEIATRYNINRSRANYFAKKVRLKQNIKSTAGRPKAIDKESDLILAQVAQDIKNQDISNDDRKHQFKKAIREQYRKSFLRKQSNNDMIVKRVYTPPRTIRRYISMYDFGVQLEKIY